MNRLRILRVCFVLYGVVMSSAIFFVFIPNSLIVRIGETFELPPYEVSPVFEYMARGMSGLCFVFGLFILYVGLHLREYARLVRVIGWLATLSLPVVLFIHLKVPTPFLWKLGDLWGVFLLCAICFATPKQPEKPILRAACS